jgi:thioredoxin-disulfide reductase
MKDLIIVGAGPAGITAAIYAARKKLDFSVISKDIGGQAAWSGDIENYTGYQFISGPELAIKFKKHLEQFKFDLQEGVEVIKVEKEGDYFKIITSKGESLSSRTVIIASGKRPRMLNVPGEAEFKNRGVTYCATCDGPLFANKDVAIIGGGNSGLDAALQMMRIATKVYLIDSADELSGDPVMQDKVKASPKVEILNKTKTLEIKGEKFVKGIKVETEGKQREMKVEGVFVEIGLIPNSEFIDLVKKDEKKEIIVNGAAETSHPGVFAAGDVSNVPEKQIIVAAGEGSKASLSAFKYLSTH